MIPPSEYRTDPESGVRYVTYEDVLKYHGETGESHLRYWMHGQTGILLVPSGTMSVTMGIYVHDYERWAGREKEHASD